MRTKNFFLTLLLAAMIFVPAHLGAQVTIGSGEAPRATLDVVAAEGIHPGIIHPNVTRAQLIALPDFTSDQRGAVVYVTNANVAAGTTHPQTANITAAGLHFFDGNVWQPVSESYTGVFPVQISADNQISVTFPIAAMTSNQNYLVMPYHRGTLPSTNLNYIVNPGFYRINVATTYGPVATGNTAFASATLQVMANNASIQQMLFHQNGRVYSRVRRGSYEWTDWIDLTANDRGWDLGGNTATATNNILGTTNAQPLRIRTGTGDIENTERIRIDHNFGNVGIGTTTTTHRLQIAGGNSNNSSFTMWLDNEASAGWPVLRTVNEGTNFTLGEILWGRNQTMNSTSNTAALRANAFIRATAPDDESGSLFFGTRANNSIGTRMAIVGENVGIGTNAPAARLDVHGQVRFFTPGESTEGRILRSATRYGDAVWTDPSFEARATEIHTHLPARSLWIIHAPVDFQIVNTGADAGARIVGMNSTVNQVLANINTTLPAGTYMVFGPNSNRTYITITSTADTNIFLNEITGRLPTEP